MSDLTRVTYHAVMLGNATRPIALLPSPGAARTYAEDSFGANYEQRGVQVKPFTLNDLAVLVGVLAGGRQA